MNTSATLYRAADLIEELGWGQGGATWQACQGVICIDEALARAQGFTGCNVAAAAGGIELEALMETPAATAMVAYLSLQSDTIYSSTEVLYGWNDRLGRTASEVIEALRACAVIEASRERETAAVAS